VSARQTGTKQQPRPALGTLNSRADALVSGHGMRRSFDRAREQGWRAVDDCRWSCERIPLPGDSRLPTPKRRIRPSLPLGKAVPCRPSTCVTLPAMRRSGIVSSNSPPSPVAVPNPPTAAAFHLGTLNTSPAGPSMPTSVACSRKAKAGLQVRFHENHNCIIEPNSKVHLRGQWRPAAIADFGHDRPRPPAAPASSRFKGRALGGHRDQAPPQLNEISHAGSDDESPLSQRRISPPSTAPSDPIQPVPPPSARHSAPEPPPSPPDSAVGSVAAAALKLMLPPLTASSLADRFRTLGKMVETERQATLDGSPRMMRSIIASAEAEAHAAQLSQQQAQVPPRLETDKKKCNSRKNGANFNTNCNHEGSQIFSAVSGRTFTMSVDGVLSI